MDIDSPTGFLAYMAGFTATVIGLTATVGALAIPAPWLGHERAICALVAVGGLTAGLTLLWLTVLRDDYPLPRPDDINERWERDLAMCEDIDKLDIPADEKSYLKATVMLGGTRYAHLVDTYRPQR